MPFIDIEDENGKVTGTAHINFGGKGNRNFRYCVFCLREGRRRQGGKLCDFPVGNPQIVTHPKTCDLSMCDKHAKSIGPDKDVCPDHNFQFCGAADPHSPRVCDLPQDHLNNPALDKRHNDSTFPIDATERTGVNRAIEERKARNKANG